MADSDTNVDAIVSFKEEACYESKITNAINHNNDNNESMVPTDKKEEATVSASVPQSQPLYPGDAVDETTPPDGKYQKLDFINPFQLVCFYDQSIAEGIVTLHPWQREVQVSLAEAKPTNKHPCKYCLIAANGSGKDKFILAPFAIWFALTKIRSRCIITTASGTQLTSQTEPYITDLANKVNAFHGQEVFRVRQRYIKCLLTGSEIRLFATDEKGKAEGYHPIDAVSEMAIIVNEGKSVSEDIHEALRRCTGYNYWLEVSSAGEPKGFFYKAATKWPNVIRITSYDCPHLSSEDIEEDRSDLGEHSAFFRSKHLSLFTSIGGQVVIPMELINTLLEFPPAFEYPAWKRRVGIDLAAGGDETVVCITQGNKCLKEFWFRETDTVLAAQRIHDFLSSEKFPKDYEHIYADDGGVGRAIIDNLVHKSWQINRVMNQWAALSDKKQFGNRGAENWYRVKRIIEEKFFDLRQLSKLTIEQLHNRHYKQSLTGGRIFLRDKREEKSEGFKSPDRADAFILSLTGLTVDDFIKDSPNKVNTPKPDNRPKETFASMNEAYEHYENEVTFGKWNTSSVPNITKTGNRLTKTLRRLISVL